MGATPQRKDITIEFECQFRVGFPKSAIEFDGVVSLVIAAQKIDC